MATLGFEPRLGGRPAGGAEARIGRQQAAAALTRSGDSGGHQFDHAQVGIQRLAQAAHLGIHLTQLRGLRLQQLGFPAAVPVQLEDQRPEVQQQRLAYLPLLAQAAAHPAALPGSRARWR